MRGNRFSRGSGLVLLGLVVAFGCRSSRPTPAEPVAEPSAALGQSQVADVQFALARTLEARGQGRDAIPIYAEAVKNDPRRADGWVRLAVSSDKEGLFAESAGYYQKALALEPTNADTYCNLGYSLYLQQRLLDAEAALRRAIELKPDHQRAQNNLGLVLARSGRGPEALDAFRRAGCTPADAHANLAYGLTMNGALPDARAQYEQALALDATSTAARKGLGELAAYAPKAATKPVQDVAAKPAPTVLAASYNEPAPVEAPQRPTYFDPVAADRVILLPPPQLVDLARVVPRVSALKSLAAQAGCECKLDPPSY